MEWNTALYNTKHHFVAEYGKELLDFIPIPRSNPYWIWDAAQEP